MNRIRHWLTERLSRLTSIAVTGQRGSDHEERVVSKEDGPVGVFTISRARTNIDDLTRNSYHNATGDTQPNLEIIESPAQPSNVSESFNPYDRGTYKVLKK